MVAGAALNLGRPCGPLSLTSGSHLWAMELFLNPTGFPVLGLLHKVHDRLLIKNSSQLQ